MDITKKNVYLIDYGTLLPKSDEEFDAYTNVYGCDKWGFYDYNQATFITDNEDDIEKEARECMDCLENFYDDGNYYCIVTYQGRADYYYNADDEDFEIDLDTADYSQNAIVYSLAMINGQIVENYF